MPPGSCPANATKAKQVEFRKGGLWVIVDFAKHAEHWFASWSVMTPVTGRGTPLSGSPGFPQPRQAFETALGEITAYLDKIDFSAKGVLGWNPEMPL